MRKTNMLLKEVFGARTWGTPELSDETIEDLLKRASELCSFLNPSEELEMAILRLFLDNKKEEFGLNYKVHRLSRIYFAVSNLIPRGTEVVIDRCVMNEALVTFYALCDELSPKTVLHRYYLECLETDVSKIADEFPALLVQNQLRLILREVSLLLSL
ncbi:hypothetical protein [Eubacterium oxidoreducens]|uniref:Uncharacterized protein n=1 Tax=Eubacterium oxidoreducens TaxID=1732 RepID=A0A1G6C403_EUBOX|nr:hypothetical protein [Eubacterium oxidoreducens]SDB27609.1 hypothetical protein SAMN02910417_02054 [Eubacterium oxidoreducens]